MLTFDSLRLFFIQMWSLYQNIFLYRYTFHLLLEFLVKTLYRGRSSFLPKQGKIVIFIPLSNILDHDIV